LWTRGIVRHRLRVVDNAELDGIESELLSELVDGDLQRHHAWGFTLRAHRIRFRQIELGEIHLGPPSGGPFVAVPELTCIAPIKLNKRV
jgi:hypothetical protein